MSYLTRFWLYHQFGSGYKWTTLVHSGVMFSSPYKPHKIPILYNNKEIILSPIAEEYATLYARYKNTEYIKNKRFNKNFWKDFSKYVKEFNILDLENCNFDNIYNYLKQQKELSLSSSSEDKEHNKKLKQDIEKKYTVAMVDGKEQPVGNYKIEPPGIFIGRGDHPKLGCIKRRIYPEDITINIGKDAPIPKCPEGYKWKKIIHDRNVEWLASWRDDITGKTKYVWLSANSDIKNKNDIEKYDLARKLKHKIKHIHEINDNNMINTNIKIRQLATALYFIDNFALRVGNEKGDDKADTVGVLSLRLEHIKLLENNLIQLDFLGKDSIRYKNKVKVSDQVYKNINDFIKNKDKYDMIFDMIIPNDMNKYLQSLMKDLTSKVFRTYNASYLFYNELRKIDHKLIDYDKSDKLKVILDLYNKANAKVALLCNHQKNVSKSFESQIENINNMLKTIKHKIKNATNSKRKSSLISKYKQLKAKKQLRLELKNVSLGTSKINYIDPRITVAFLKRHDVPINKLFNSSLQLKFKWALDIDKDWKY